MELVTRLFGEAWEHRRRRYRAAGLAAVLAIAVTATAFALLGGGGGGAGSGRRTGPAGSALNSHRVSSFLLSNYAILRDHRVSPKTLPTGRPILDHVLNSPSWDRLGLDIGDIGESEPVPGLKLWLIPGTSGYCFVESSQRYGGATSCGPDGGNRFGPGAFGSGPNGQSAVGFVVDGVSRITVHLAGGGEFVVPVKDNAYVINTPNGRTITELSAITASGRVIRHPGG